MIKYSQKYKKYIANFKKMCYNQKKIAVKGGGDRETNAKRGVFRVYDGDVPDDLHWICRPFGYACHYG